MVKIYIQTTHSKFTYEDDDLEARKIMLTKFIAEDTKLKHDPRVKSGYLDPNTNFYSEEHDICPTGLLPYVYQYFKKSKIKYELIDLREFPPVNKTFVKKLMENEINFGKYTPRDYQIEAVLSIIKNSGGIIQLPTGCVSGDTIINVHRCGIGFKTTIKRMYQSFNETRVGKRKYDKSKKTFVRSFIDNEGVIKLNEVDFVKYSGVQKVYKLTLENGLFLKATADHKIMTDFGWIEMINLTNNHSVMCDTLKAEKNGIKKKKTHDLMVQSLHFHPYAPITKTKKDKSGFTKRVEKHRAIYEAHINNLTLDEYKYILRKDEERSKTLIYVDVKNNVIHHKDFDHYNNDINNLVEISIEDHKKIHMSDNIKNFNQGVPKYSKVISVEYSGEEDTYDIGCFSNHNFVANGMVIHNSGKTFIAFLLTKVYSKSKILFVFDRIDLVHQLYNDFTVKYNMDENNIAIIQGDNYKYNKNCNIILLSMQSYERAFHVFPQIKVICCDEVHTTGRTETAQKIIYSCQKASMHIGLSATPDVIENPVEQLRLYSIMGPIIYKKEIKEQIENNTLSDTRVEIYHIDIPEEDRPEIIGSYADVYEKFKIDKDEIKQTIINNNLLNIESEDFIKAFKREYKKLSDEDKEELEQEALEIICNNWIEEDPENNSVINEDGIKILRKFIQLGDESTHYIYNKVRNQKIADIARKYNKRTLIIFSKIKHGEQLQELLPEAKLVHGEHSLAERNEAEKYLKENSNAIVLSSNIWSTGKDIPEIEVFINAGAGVSKIQQIQKMGRATRLSPKTGKEEAIVVDFKDSFSPLGMKQSIKRLTTYKQLKLKIEEK